MWLWRRTPPGMVRINHRKLIELQQGAIRAYRLETQIRETQRQAAVAAAAARVAGQGLAERTAVAHLVEDPPLTVDGQLHEQAFDAAVDAAVWARREQELAALGIGSDSTQGGQ